jgi:hypothetical protein
MNVLFFIGLYVQILRGIRVTAIAVEKSNKYYIFSVCVCSLSYPSCKAHTPYYTVRCGLSGSTVFSTFSRK